MKFKVEENNISEVDVKSDYGNDQKNDSDTETEIFNETDVNNDTQQQKLLVMMTLVIIDNDTEDDFFIIDNVDNEIQDEFFQS